MTKYFPPKLFRYRSHKTKYFFDELENAISFNKIFLSCAINVNDPFEFKPIYAASPASEVLRNLKNKFGSNPALSKELMERYFQKKFSRNEFRREFRHFRVNTKAAHNEIEAVRRLIISLQKQESLACFSETDKSIPMWAHYSENHSGVCLEFALKPDKHLDAYPLPNKVQYSPLRPTLTTSDIQAFMDRGEMPNKEKRADRTFNSLYLTKAEDWRYEKEWRISERLHGKSQYVKIPSISVCGIKFGIRSDEDIIGKVLSRFGHRVPVFKAELSKQNFDVHFKRLN